MINYPAYKSVNLHWLKEIPTHWNLQRNKNIFTELKNEVGSNSGDYVLLSLTLKGVILRDMEGGGKFPQRFDKYKIVQKGNMIFCLFDMDETPRTVGLSGYDGMITGAYTIMKINNINPGYVYYYYLALDNIKALKPFYTGLRKTISINTFQNIKLPIPSYLEQEQIVYYLDWKISRINQLINIKQKEIKVIDSLKHSMVNHVILKGTSKDVDMKYSGEKWLGDIPVHWNIIKLRQILNPISVKGHPELPLLSVIREQGVVIRDVKDVYSNHNFIPDDLSGYKMVRKGQFVINKMKAWQGSYGISKYIGIVSPAYFVFNVMYDNLEYFHYVIRSKLYVNFFAQASDGIRVGQWDLQMNRMKDIPFIVPPKEEQVSIVNDIKKNLSKYDRIIEKLFAEIENLQELKARLISDVVTGKMDVRDIVIPEYDYVEEENNGVEAEDAVDEK